MFQACFGIMRLFALDNQEYQQILFKRLAKILMNYTQFNLGQVEFINGLFRNNYHLIG
jgi:hypothetical protein